MLELLIFFIIISSGSVLCSSLFNKKYEEIIPITCALIVLILFIFGMLNILEVGAGVVCVMAFICYIVAIIWSIKHKCVKAWLKNIFSLPFIVYVLLYFVSVYTLRGKVLHSWDEFTHWGVVVKEMVLQNDLGTNPMADLTFSTYPPGISLFQYFLQKIYIWITGNEFSEWLLYVAFQVFSYAFLVPFIGSKIKKNVLYGLTSAALIFLAPIFFYKEVCSTLYVDPLIGILAGAGMATVLWGKRECVNLLHTIAICSMLVLVKDAGIMFAIIVAVTYMVVVCWEQKKLNKKLVVNGIGLLASICIPQILWNIDIAINQANRLFSAPIEFGQLLNIVLHRDTSYRMTVWNVFWKYLFMVPIELGNTGITLSYFSLFLIFISIFMIIVKKADTKQMLAQKTGMVVIGMSIAQTAIYIIGLGVTYIFKFDEFEAMQLASYNRYMNIAYLALWITIILSIVRMLDNTSGEYKNVWCIGILTVGILISPVLTAYNHVIEREPVYMSIKLREPYELLLNKIEHQTEEDDRIYIITQESNGFENWILRYELRTRKINKDGYSIGESFYEGDVYTTEISPQEWMHKLCEQYDYVALYQINNYFVEHYGDLFGEAGVVTNGVYRVNRESQTLEFVE